MDNISHVNSAQSGSSEALERIAKENKPLVVSIAKRFLNRGVECDDLVQIGMLGLIKAAKNFDTSYNTKFSTYAVPLITGEIKRHLRDDGQVKVSRSLKEIAQKIARYREEYLKKHFKEPSLGEICESLGITADTATMAVSSQMPVSSLYQQISGDDELYLIDTVAVSDNGDDAIDSIALKTAVNSLDERERQVIKMRYFSGSTQTQIAKVLGISQVQVSRIEKKSLLKLRELVGG